MVGPFEIAVGGLVATGVIGVGWALWPVLRPKAAPSPEPDPPKADPASPDLPELVVEDGDRARAWRGTRPLVDRERIGLFRPADGVLVARRGDRAGLVPAELFLQPAEPTDATVIRGRTFGKPVVAVRLTEGTYLDLVGAALWLPRIALELDGEGPITLLRLDGPDAVDSLPAEALDTELGVKPPVPEGGGFHAWTFELDGQALQVNAWIPGLRDSIGSGEPLHVARVHWGEHIVDAVCDPDGRAAIDGELDPCFAWSRTELLELANLAQRLPAPEMALQLVRTAFAERVAPGPRDDDEALVVAAVLNWAGALLRRHGFPNEAIGVLDAGLGVCRDQDNQADLHYNRGYARLHVALGGVDPDVGPDRERLQAAVRDFTVATGLSPTDPDPWSRIAMVQQLLGNDAAASEAWLQAATRARDDEARREMLANAEAIAGK